MKILMLTPYLPFPLMSGGQTRSYNLIMNLSKKHEITLFSLIKDNAERKYIPELLKFCKNVRVFNRPPKPWTLHNILRTGFGTYPFLVVRNLATKQSGAIEEELSSNKYDLIHAETFYVMPHIPITNTPPILLVEQTVEYLVYKHYVTETASKLLAPLLSIDVMKLKFWERYYWKRAKKVVAMSDSDRVQMEILSPGLSIDIVPNGIDTDYFAGKKREKPDPPKVLYVGNFTWLQNIEAVELLINKVWPKIKKQVPQAKLWIVGMHMTDYIRNLKSNDIDVSEGMPDIRDAYRKSTVLVTPIRGPGGTRLKILEAMASSLPVVTTTVGAEGLGVKNGKEALVEDNLEDLVASTVKILKDPMLAQKLGTSGWDFVRKNYTWDISAQKLSRIYEEIVSEK
ncbi:MAG: Glycosyl transferase group 1 [Candidatus Woesebacteria bacterium GW2011_GWA2_40_7b]|uniref:Glycosyl transferase group 1 n=1 Tax=Candidatus Woesebacteria bacterium GW2011_GWA2_40_7b TaxID=1618563 RepID=A0A0G0VG27_9BACT|nr:MAG: Glycosyl transferase group 1 [Candidatus Woesebacteria bacterium GW2011_GWA2_40_7b]